MLDLSSYYLDDAVEKREAQPGVSLFAAEFDRLHGRIQGERGGIQ